MSAAARRLRGAGAGVLALAIWLSAGVAAAAAPMPPAPAGLPASSLAQSTSPILERAASGPDHHHGGLAR